MAESDADTNADTVDAEGDGAMVADAGVEEDIGTTGELTTASI